MKSIRARKFIAYSIRSESIKSIYDIVEKFRGVAKTGKINFLRLPIYRDEDKYVDDLRVIETEKMKFLPVSIMYKLTLGEFLEFLRKERRMSLSTYEYIIPSIPQEKLREKIVPIYEDFIVYEGSNIIVVVDEKLFKNIDYRLNQVLGGYDKEFINIDDINDFILWIFYKYYRRDKINNLHISDITFQSREEVRPVSKKHIHKGVRLPLSDEILLGIAKANQENIHAAKIRIAYNSSELEFYIEGRGYVMLFNPVLKGYKLEKEEAEIYNSNYKKIKAIYELIYKIYPTLVSAYKSERDSWPREDFIQRARAELIKRLQEGFAS